MEDENRLRKDKEQYDPSKRRIPKMYYSLTANAKKEHLFGILGNDPAKERLRKLYHLLFFFQAFSPIRYISSDEQLDRALSLIQKSRKDLIPEGNHHIDGTNYSEVNYRSIGHAKISKVEYSDQGPNKLTKVSYYYRLESFSLKEVKSYLARPPIHNFPSNNNNNNVAAAATFAPFASGIYFTGKEMTTTTEEELDKAFNTLQKNHLIQPITNWLSDDDENENENDKKRSEDDTRFIFADGLLRELIYRIWTIQGFQLDILRDKINYLSEEPKETEIQMLARLYGESEADRIIHAAHLRNRNSSKSKIKKKTLAADTKAMIENDKKMVRGLIRQVNEKYRKVICDEYEFPPDLLEGVCLEKIFTHRERKR
jgi:hypothetical protein